MATGEPMKIFDLEKFQKLIDGDKALFRELVELYQKDWPSLIEKLKLATSQQDRVQVEKVAHRLRGLARNFFSMPAAELAESIEMAALEKNEFPSSKDLDQLNRHLMDLEGALVGALDQLS